MCMCVVRYIIYDLPLLVILKPLLMALAPTDSGEKICCFTLRYVMLSEAFAKLC